VEQARRIATGKSPIKTTYMLKIHTLFLLSALGTLLQAQPHWECMVRANDEWNYFIGNSQASNGWHDTGFDDESWNRARGSFGFGDGDDTTVMDIRYSLYIRHTFSVADISAIDSLILDIDYDDAYVAYLNGTVISRSYNVDTDYPAYNYTPVIDQEALMYSGGQPSRVAVPKNLLQNGSNLIAVLKNISTPFSWFSINDVSKFIILLLFPPLVSLSISIN